MSSLVMRCSPKLQCSLASRRTHSSVELNAIATASEEKRAYIDINNETVTTLL